MARNNFKNPFSVHAGLDLWKTQSVRTEKILHTVKHHIPLKSGRHSPKALIQVNFHILLSKSEVRDSNLIPAQPVVIALPREHVSSHQGSDNTDRLGAFMEQRNQQFNGPDFSQLPSDLISIPLSASWRLYQWLRMSWAI